jgi:hypothetical protein
MTRGWKATSRKLGSRVADHTKKRLVHLDGNWAVFLINRDAKILPPHPRTLIPPSFMPILRRMRDPKEGIFGKCFLLFLVALFFAGGRGASILGFIHLGSAEDSSHWEF